MVLAHIALGSNLGHRSLALARGIQQVSQRCGKIVKTSFLYESSPVLLTAQPSFLNAAITIDTTLAPHDLLRELQSIEPGKAAVRYGPRQLDLDILLYGNDKTVHTDDLVIPHPRIAERDFVLKPLVDLGMQNALINGESVANLTAAADVKSTTRTCEFSDSNCWNDLDEVVRIAGILNVTPDSFSDGGLYESTEVAIGHAKAMVRDGADWVDIGGESTRPGAEPVSEQEELDRVIPVIERLRQDEEFDQVVISVDTYKPSVAKQAIQAGANVINDVSGGNDGLLQVASDHCVPIVLMHNRGSSKTMDYLDDYAGKGVTTSVVEWLQERVQYAVSEYQIPRWNIWIDPGFGFAKNEQQNYELLSATAHIVRAHPNVFFGTSRKRFVRAAAKYDVDVATAATTAIAVAEGARLFRVHDVQKTVDAAGVAQAMCHQLKRKT